MVDGVDLEGFGEWLERQDKAAHTVTGYLAGVRHFARWYAARFREALSPVAVTPLDVRDYRDGMLKWGFSPNTINQRLSALAAFFSWAQARGQVEVNPTASIKQVAVQKGAPRWLDRREQYALKRALRKAAQLAALRAGGDLRHYAIWRERRNTALVSLMLNAALRVSEVAALTTEDLVINERSGHVVVRSLPGSGKRKHRQVPLNADARRALRGWLAVRKGEEDASAHGASFDKAHDAPLDGAHDAPFDRTHGALFIGQRGDPLSSRGIQRVVARYAAKAGLEGVTPHVLRHTGAHNLVQAGVSLICTCVQMQVRPGGGDFGSRAAGYDGDLYAAVEARVAGGGGKDCV